LAEIMRLQLGRDVPARAREWVRDICATCGLDPLADAVALMVSELVTNAFLHAQTDCLVKAELVDHVIYIEVTDEDQADVRPVSQADGSECGRGLHIVAALATNWGIDYQPTGKTIWFTLAATASVHSRSRIEQSPSTPPRSAAAG
jgi:anti-sigma regulatory factor (Ser/Thr protein kinase)